MSQPMTQTEAALEEFRKAGVPIERIPRPYASKRMTGHNADVYASWIQQWAMNAAANYPVVKGSLGVAFLRNCAKGVPAIVVGIGPSLDDAILDLKRAPRHAIIIATDAALRPLVRHGIHPDIVVNYDARDTQPTMWDTIDTSPYVLLANSVTSPYTIDAWKGKAMFFNMRQDNDEFCTNILPSIFPYLGQLSNLGTVGNGAIHLAHYMGCSAIFSVGMDLCYAKAPESPAPMNVPPKESILAGAAWRYRCKDWHFVLPTAEIPEGMWREVENKVLYDNAERMKRAFDEEIKGKIYKTDGCLQLYRNALIAAVGQSDIPLNNCSGGVMSDLVPTITLREALERKCYPALEPGRTVAKHLPALVPAANREWRLLGDSRIFIPTNPADLWSQALEKR